MAIMILAVFGVSWAGAEEATLRVECRKTSDRGCSANGAPAYQAPPGKYVKATSLSTGTVINYWAKNPVCGAAKPAGFVVYAPQGVDVEAQLPTSFTAPLHVESGSGGINIGKVAFVNCRYTFVPGDIPGN